MSQQAKYLFREVHKSMDRILELVLSGKAVPSETFRQAALDELDLIRGKAQRIREALKGGDQS